MTPFFFSFSAGKHFFIIHCGKIGTFHLFRGIMNEKCYSAQLCSPKIITRKQEKFYNTRGINLALQLNRMAIIT